MYTYILLVCWLGAGRLSGRPGSDASLSQGWSWSPPRGRRPSAAAARARSRTECNNTVLSRSDRMQ